MQVKEGSFRHIPNAVMDDKYDHTDGNDLPMALIKISTENIPEQERLKLMFSGNRATQIVKTPKIGQMWIYITANSADFIEIKHPDYGTCKYYLPEQLCDFCTYEMVLQYVDHASVVETGVLAINTEPDEADVYVDGKHYGKTMTVITDLAEGAHTLKLEKQGYVTLAKSIDIVKGETLKLNETLQSISSQKTYLIVKADQADARIYIDGELVNTGEASKSVNIGTTHTYKIECKLYHEENGSVTINDRTTIEKKLRPNFGYISVTTSPEQGAKVYIDDEYLGLSPIKSDKLKSGSHKVMVMKDMYKMKEQSFIVNDGQTTNANILMSVNFVTLTVDTDADSDIYVDEEYKGKGRWTGRAAEGFHAIEARKANHKTSRTTVDLALGESKNITLEAPKPITGSVDINSSPMGAEIYIDGKHYGQTPIIIEDVLIGEHELKLDKDDYALLMKNITIEEGKTLALEDTLEVGREMTIVTDVIGDTIYVDGHFVGSSPVNIRLSYGAHEFKSVRNSMVLSRSIVVAETGDGKIRLMFNEINGHEYVDLGLPSGLLWATCNIGANKPEDYGDYYAWGEIHTKAKYGYNSDYKKLHKKEISGNPQYDAARANWKGAWRMPTKDEFQELIDKCKWEWTGQKGITGYKITGTNGNSIFLPLAGYCYGEKKPDIFYSGCYWSSTVYEGSYSDNINYLSFSSYNSYEVSKYGNGYTGYSIRPVCSSVEYYAANTVDGEELVLNNSLELSYDDSYFYSDAEVAKIEFTHHSLSILGGVAMGLHYMEDAAAMYGADENYTSNFVKAIGLEYGLLDDGEYSLFLNTVYYPAKNKRPAFSFMLGTGLEMFRFGVGFCYAEYYVPSSYLVENEYVKGGFSFGMLIGGNCNINGVGNGIFTYDCGMFLLGSHVVFDLRLGIGLTWKKK